jgi:hypothetical protein
MQRMKHEFLIGASATDIRGAWRFLNPSAADIPGRRLGVLSLGVTDSHHEEGPLMDRHLGRPDHSCWHARGRSRWNTQRLKFGLGGRTLGAFDAASSPVRFSLPVVSTLSF